MDVPVFPPQPPWATTSPDISRPRSGPKPPTTISAWMKCGGRCRRSPGLFPTPWSLYGESVNCQTTSSIPAPWRNDTTKRSDPSTWTEYSRTRGLDPSSLICRLWSWSPYWRSRPGLGRSMSRRCKSRGVDSTPILHDSASLLLRLSRNATFTAQGDSGFSTAYRKAFAPWMRCSSPLRSTCASSGRLRCSLPPIRSSAAWRQWPAVLL